MFNEKTILKKAKKKYVTIVFPEASFSDRTMNAVKYLNKKKIVKAIILGDESSLVLRYKDKLKGITIINPKTSGIYEKLLECFLEKRKNKGLSKKEAETLLLDPLYFGTMLVEYGIADGMVAGAESPSSKVIRPALQIIKAKKQDEIVSSFMIFYGKNKIFRNREVIFGADVGLNVEPNAETLAQIAKQTANSFEKFSNQKAKVAFLSYSTKGSAEGKNLEKVKTATAIMANSNYLVDGEMQLDAAICPEIAKTKNSKLKIKGDANVLIFPDLNSGNICYKAIQYFGNNNAIGPILQNLNKPINDLSRGCCVRDIIIVSAITALQV